MFGKIGTKTYLTCGNVILYPTRGLFSRMCGRVSLCMHDVYTDQRRMNN
jgi:hypothetical protein